MTDVRLIDANALDDEFEAECAGDCGCCRHHAFRSTGFGCKLIANAPTIDAVEVVHSSWGYRAYRSDMRITVSGEAVCRKCHAPFFRVRGHWFKYCPNCGAKMDGGTEE